MQKGRMSAVDLQLKGSPHCEMHIPSCLPARLDTVTNVACAHMLEGTQSSLYPSFLPGILPNFPKAINWTSPLFLGVSDPRGSRQRASSNIGLLEDPGHLGGWSLT